MSDSKLDYESSHVETDYKTIFDYNICVIVYGWLDE